MDRSPNANEVTVAEIVDHLAASFRFAGSDRVLRYANKRDLQREDIRQRLGKSVEDCHGPSLEEFRRVYAEWESGSREVEVYIHESTAEGAPPKFDILIPVHGPEGFMGVAELLFNAEPQER